MFRFGSAEDLPVKDSSVTLITAGRAIQYFDFPKFFRECQRALAPGGIVAFYSSEHIKFVIDDHDGYIKIFLTALRFQQRAHVPGLCYMDSINNLRSTEWILLEGLFERQEEKFQL